jgi:glycosyltransferase involved in cell wall biosynthesis
LKKKVWIASELYYPELTSTGYFMTGIAESIAHHAEVEVLCSQPTYALRGQRAPRREERNGIQIWRANSTTFPKDQIIGRLINLITFSVAVFFRAVTRMRKGDQLLVVTAPATLPFVMLLAAKLRGVRSAMLVYDVYPEVLVASGFMKRESTVVRLATHLSSLLFDKYDEIVVIGRDMRDLIAARTANASDKITVIPNWSDTQRIRPSKESGIQIRARFGLENKFIVQYLGNMGRTHGIATIVEAADSLREHSDIHFLFIGEGFQKRFLVEAVASRRLTNVTILPSCPADELNAYLNACDLALIAFRADMAGVAVPSRMYGVMAAGKPILAVADEGSEIERVVIEDQIGIVVPPENPSRLTAAILGAQRGDVDLALLGRRSRQAAVTKYSKELILERYIAVFDLAESVAAQLGQSGAIGAAPPDA